MKVRLRPYNPAIGNVKRAHGAPFKDANGQAITYQAGVWYDLDDDEEEAIAYLRGIRQVSRDPGSPLAFDVCTEEEAEKLQAEEEVIGVVRRAETPPSETSGPVQVKQRKDATLNAPRPKHELSAAAVAKTKEPPKAKPRPAKPSASKASAGSKTPKKSTAKKKAAPKRKTTPRRKGST